MKYSIRFNATEQEWQVVSKYFDGMLWLHFVADDLDDCLQWVAKEDEVTL